MKKMIPTRLLTAMMATGLMLATTSALATESSQSREQRRAARADKSADKEQPARFADATREEPSIKASAKMSPKLKKLFDMLDKEQVEEGVALAGEIIADEKANAYDRSISARVAGGLLIDSDPARAISFLQQAVDLGGLGNSDHYDSMFIVAQLQAQQEDLEGALATLDRLLTETRSQDPEILVRKGSFLRELERYPEAITALKAAIDASPEPKPEWQQQLMAAYADAGQGEEAARLAEQLAASTPDDPRAQRNLAVTYLQTEQYAKGAEVLERLRAAGQLTEESDYRNLMVAYVYSDDAQPKVIEVINEGLDKGILKPSHQTYLALAQAYYFGEPSQVDRAIEAFRKAAPLSDNGETWLNLAKVLSNEGRLDEAKQAAQQALDKGIRSPEDAKNILSRKN